MPAVPDAFHLPNSRVEAQSNELMTLFFCGYAVDLLGDRQRANEKKKIERRYFLGAAVASALRVLRCVVCVAR